MNPHAPDKAMFVMPAGAKEEPGANRVFKNRREAALWGSVIAVRSGVGHELAELADLPGLDHLNA
jgi:hypothetical protein